MDNTEPIFNSRHLIQNQDLVLGVLWMRSTRSTNGVPACKHSMKNSSITGHWTICINFKFYIPKHQITEDDLGSNRSQKPPHQPFEDKIYY